MDPSFVIEATKALLSLKGALDAAALRRRVDQIEKTVDAIGYHLAANMTAEIRSGFSHLEVAMGLPEGALRKDELGFARQVFNRLANRVGPDPLMEEYGGLSTQQVSAFGYFGNFHYFMLSDEPLRGLAAAYRVVELFPPFGLLALPAELFSRDYCREVPGMSQTREALTAAYRVRLDEHKARRRAYGWDMAWRVPAGAGAVLAGLAGGLVSPPLAGQGVMWATGILSTSKDGLTPPAKPSDRPYLDQATAAEAAWLPVVTEARERRAMIEKRM